MPRRRRNSGCLVFGLFAALGAAACLWAVLVLPASFAALGEPAAQLSGFDRTLLATYLIVNQRDLSSPAGPQDLFATLEVEPGQDASTVAAELASLGVLKDPELLTRYLRYRGLDTGIEAGSYEVNGSMSPRDLAELLQRALASRYTLTIPEGWRREEVAEALAEFGLGFTAADFLTASQTAPPRFVEPPGRTADLEGFLFPDTYRLDPRLTADEAVALMVETFEDRVGGELLAAFEAKGLTPYEAVILASIVERESALAAERPLIASVFFNRLALGRSDGPVRPRTTAGWQLVEGAADGGRPPARLAVQHVPLPGTSPGAHCQPRVGFVAGGGPPGRFGVPLLPRRL